MSEVEASVEVSSNHSFSSKHYTLDSDEEYKDGEDFLADKLTKENNIESKIKVR